MNGAAVDVAVRLGLQDQATPGIDKAAQRTTTAAKKTTAEVEASNTRQRASYERTSQAREVLGVRSEQRIQREIQQTEAAYERLMRTAKLTANEQARALDATRAKVTALTNEMGKLTKAQEQAARGSKLLQIGGGVVAGTMAGSYVLKQPVGQAMSFDLMLANMANTAYAERDAVGRAAGEKQLEAAINKARKLGGSTREQAASALDTMIASGVVSDVDAMTMLPGIMKTASASGADANQLATIAIRAKQSAKIDAADLPQVLSAAMRAGQVGGFELKNMAQWLPMQMAMASNLGITGKDGLAKLMAWNQAAVITAGTKDEAGTNLRDLLNEVNTPHFRGYMAQSYMNGGHHMKRGEKESKMKSVDDVFLDYQSRGIDKVSATVDMMEKIFSKNKKYQSLQSDLSKLDPKDKDGKRQILEAMGAQVQGTEVGKVFHNQQSLMAMIALMNNKDYVASVLKSVRGQYGLSEADSEVSASFAGISKTAAFKSEQAKEDLKGAEKAALDNLTPAIGKAAELFGDLASKFPLLTGATVLAVTGITAMAGAAGLAAMTLGGGVGGSAGGGAIARTAGKYLPTGKTLLRGGALGLGAMAGGAGLGAAFGEDSAVSRYGSAALNGAATGAFLGSVVPMLGTGVGAAVGGALGLGWEGLKDLLKPSADAPKMAADIKLSVSDDRVRVASTNVTSTGMNGSVQTDTGNLWAMP